MANECVNCGEMQNLTEVLKYITPHLSQLPSLNGIDFGATMIPFSGKFGGDHISFIDFKEEFDLDSIIEKAKTGNIDIKWDHTLDEVLGDDMGVTGMRIKSTGDDSTQDINVDGVFIAIGHKPNTSLFEGQLDMEHGYLTVKGGSQGNATACSIDGVYAAGDVADHIYRQAITSAGTGCMAALDAERFLDNLEG